MNETERIFAHSSIREYENDGDDEDRYYLPWRTVAEAAARIKLGQRVRTILPSHQDFEEFLELLEQELLNGVAIDRLYTSDTNYLMDRDVNRELLAELLKTTDKRTILHPYQATPEFYAWASVLQQRNGVGLHTDEKEYDNRFWWGHKGAYHRWIDDLGTPSLSEKYRLPFPNGYVVRSKEEARSALELLGASTVVLKPIFGAGGFQISFCSSAKDIDLYQWPVDPLTGGEMPVAVQEKVEIKRDAQGERTFSVQFCEGEIFGPLTRQRMSSTEWSGNVVPAMAAGEFEQACYKITKRLLNFVNPHGDGGVDLADINGEPVMLEVNGGRSTGVHAPKHFKAAFEPHASYFIFEKVQVGNFSAHEVVDKLKSATVQNTLQEVAFNKETQLGVFPIIWLRGSWGMLASFGSSFENAESQLKEAREALGV